MYKMCKYCTREQDVKPGNKLDQDGLSRSVAGDSLMIS